MWLRGEDAVLAAAVFGTYGLQQTGFQRFKPAGVSRRETLTGVLCDTQSSCGYKCEQNDGVTDQGAFEVSRHATRCQDLIDVAGRERK